MSAAFTNIGASGGAGPGGMNTSTGGGGAAAIVFRWSALRAAEGYPLFRRCTEALGGSGGGCWVLLPKDDASSFCSEDVSHALRCLCEGIGLLSPCCQCTLALVTALCTASVCHGAGMAGGIIEARCIGSSALYGPDGASNDGAGGGS